MVEFNKDGGKPPYDGDKVKEYVFKRCQENPDLIDEFKKDWDK